MSSPYISIVIATRNDNYGENMQQRLSMFVKSLDRYQLKYPSLFELIVVEWNPPTNTPSLAEIIPQCSNLPVRVITVPANVHNQFGTKHPLIEFRAKNVGIRRSRGEYVLITNPDILFSEDMIEQFSLRILTPNVLYRTDRFDFKSYDIDMNDVDSYVPYAIKNTFHGHLSDDNLYSINHGTNLSDFPKSDYSRLHTNASGDFILSHRSSFDLINGLYEDDDFSHHADSISVIRFFYSQIPQCILSAPMCIFHQDHARGQREMWDPIKAHQIGKTIGRNDWGLTNYNFAEWSNKD